MELKESDIKQFKKDVYKYYKKLFPALERKSYRILKKSYSKGTTSILGILEQNKIIGFMIINQIKNNKYMQLDYFAIFPEYQSKGYGKQAIIELKKLYSDYYGIFIEIEKIGLGENDKENELRKRRAKFYEKLGFVKLNVDLELYKVIYSPYILFCSDFRENDDKIIKDIFKIYNEILGERKINKNCRVLIDI